MLLNLVTMFGLLCLVQSGRTGAIHTKFLAQKRNVKHDISKGEPCDWLIERMQKRRIRHITPPHFFADVTEDSIEYATYHFSTTTETDESPDPCKEVIPETTTIRCVRRPDGYVNKAADQIFCDEQEEAAPHERGERRGTRVERGFKSFFLNALGLNKNNKEEKENIKEGLNKENKGEEENNDGVLSKADNKVESDNNNGEVSGVKKDEVKKIPEPEGIKKIAETEGSAEDRSHTKDSTKQRKTQSDSDNIKPESIETEEGHQMDSVENGDCIETIGNAEEENDEGFDLGVEQDGNENLKSRSSNFNRIPYPRPGTHLSPQVMPWYPTNVELPVAHDLGDSNQKASMEASIIKPLLKEKDVQGHKSQEKLEDRLKRRAGDKVRLLELGRKWQVEQLKMAREGHEQNKEERSSGRSFTDAKRDRFISKKIKREVVAANQPKKYQLDIGSKRKEGLKALHPQAIHDNNRGRRHKDAQRKNRPERWRGLGAALDLLNGFEVVDPVVELVESDKKCAIPSEPDMKCTKLIEPDMKCIKPIEPLKCTIPTEPPLPEVIIITEEPCTPTPAPSKENVLLDAKIEVGKGLESLLREMVSPGEKRIRIAEEEDNPKQMKWEVIEDRIK